MHRTGNRFSVNAMSAIGTHRRMHFLPSYSPELNADQLVNADLKRSRPHTHRAGNRTELASESRRFLHRRQPHIVRGYFCGRHVGYVIDE